MAQRKSPTRLRAEELCSQFPETPNRTLAKRLAEEQQVTVENARGLIRDCRGVKGKKTRRHATHKKPKGKAGAAPKLPPSQSDPWTPFELEADRIGVISDVHVPYHSEKAVNAAVANLKRQRPDCILINGDACDFYSISRWEKDPRKRNFKKEMDACREFFEWIRYKFKNARIVFKAGNHEERWDKWIFNHAAEICDFEEMRLDQMLKLEESGIEYVDDQRPVMAGNLPIFHGHELPKGMTNPVNMARGAFLRMIDTVLVGHGHRSSSHTESTWEHREITCWSTGCLCTLTPEYARINKWNWGHAFIEVAKDGDFGVTNMRINKKGMVRKS